MALAILEPLGLEKSSATFRIDTGTNHYYQLKIGRSIRRRAGIDLVDDVSYATPLATNEVGGGLLNTSTQVALPVKRFADGNVYAQLFTFKTAEGTSPAFSRVVSVPFGRRLQAHAPSLLEAGSMTTADTFLPPRTTACRTLTDAYARTASYDDLLAGLIKVVGPLVLDLLGRGKNGSSTTSPSSAPTGAAPQANLLASLLNSILGAASGLSGAAAVSQSESVGGAVPQENRFILGPHAHYSQTFFWPALIAAVAPALIQALPQLMNGITQRRVELKQADDKLITDILSEVDRGILLDKLLDAQRQAPPTGQPTDGADMNALIQLLQQVPASAGPPKASVAAAPPVAAGKSLSLSTNGAVSASLSSRAMVTFETGTQVPWNGSPGVVFARNRPLQLKMHLTVAAPAPATPLPRAIIKVTFKGGANRSVWFEKTFKQKNISAGSVTLLPFSADELVHLPANQAITVFAEMRWLGPQSGREFRALGSLEIVLVDKYFVKDIGPATGPERELVDMKQFRPFWNKVWEAPTLPATGGGADDGRKYLWELNVAAKYTVLLAADQSANGLMQTRLLRQTANDDSLTDRTEGRMKAGIELSIAELNKLLPLWPGHTALDSDRLAALNTNTFAKRNASELMHTLKLKGRAGQRGMIWIVPVFKLFDVTLQSVQTTDDSGQVVTVGEEKVQYPLPVSARVFGLKSQQ